MSDKKKQKPGPEPLFDDGVRKYVRLSKKVLDDAQHKAGLSVSETIDKALRLYVDNWQCEECGTILEISDECFCRDCAR